MTFPRYGRVPSLAGLAALVLFAPAAHGQTVLSDNLANATGGTETANGDTWLASSFGTGATSATLDSITLLMDETSPGVASLDLYSDGGLQPGSLVGTLTGPGAYSSTLADTTFTTSGLTLDPDSTYWAVLRTGSGSYDWAWTADDTGSGAGFQDTWSSSVDAGATWFTYDSAPTQMRVLATPAAIPEPGPLALLLIGVPLALLAARRRRAGAC